MFNVRYESKSDTITLGELRTILARATEAGVKDDAQVFVEIPLISMNNRRCRVRSMFVEEQ